MLSIRFIVANYGHRHVGMLLNHLHSIAQTHPDARVTIYWQDVPQSRLEAIRATFRHFDFVPMNFDFANDPRVRIANKVLAWSRAADEHAHEARLCFADADTLVLRGIGHFFDDFDADVIFTHNPTRENRDKAPVNTGVILARGGAAASAFFRHWKAETLHILETPELFAQANDHALPFASPDQMAMHRILGYETPRTHYEIEVENQSVRIDAAACQQLNEMNSRPLADDIHIIHFKGGWQHILLDGRPFSRWRPRRLSWQMFIVFLNSFLAALARLNVAAGTQFSARDFGIVVPWHFNPDGKFSAVRYALWRAREMGKRAWLLATRQLPSRP